MRERESERDRKSEREREREREKKREMVMHLLPKEGERVRVCVLGGDQRVCVLGGDQRVCVLASAIPSVLGSLHPPAHTGLQSHPRGSEFRLHPQERVLLLPHAMVFSSGSFSSAVPFASLSLS